MYFLDRRYSLRNSSVLERKQDYLCSSKQKALELKKYVETVEFITDVSEIFRSQVLLYPFLEHTVNIRIADFSS